MQALCLGPVFVHLFNILFRIEHGNRNIFHYLVGKEDFAVERQARLLAKEHFCQTEAVCGLREQEPGLTRLDLDLQYVGLGGKPRLHRLLHISFHLLQQVRIIFCQTFFCRDSDYLPVGSIDFGENADILHVVAAEG